MHVAGFSEKATPELTLDGPSTRIREGKRRGKGAGHVPYGGEGTSGDERGKKKAKKGRAESFSQRREKVGRTSGKGNNEALLDAGSFPGVRRRGDGRLLRDPLEREELSYPP